MERVDPVKCRFADDELPAPRILREAGVTATRLQGTKRLVSLRRDDLDARFPGLLDTVLAAVPGSRTAA